MSKFARFLIHTAILIAAFVLMTTVVPTLIGKYNYVFLIQIGIFLFPGFILMQLGCDILDDPKNGFLEFLRDACKWLGGIIIIFAGLIGQLASALNIDKDPIGPVLNGFYSPWLTVAVVSIFFYCTIDTLYRTNHIPFIPLISYAIGYGITFLFGLLGKYVSFFFNAWFSFTLVMATIILLIVALIKHWDFPLIDVLEGDIKRPEVKKTNKVKEMLERIEANATVLENEDTDKRYLTWLSYNAAPIYDMRNKTIVIQGKIRVNNAVAPNSPSYYNENLDELCKIYVSKKMKYITDNYDEYGKFTDGDWYVCSFDVQCKNASGQYVTVASGTSVDKTTGKAIVTLSFAPVETDDVRIVFTTNGGRSPYLKELEIYSHSTEDVLYILSQYVSLPTTRGLPAITKEFCDYTTVKRPDIMRKRPLVPMYSAPVVSEPSTDSTEDNTEE